MTFWSALILGLLASMHCAGMCGGLQSVLQQSAVIRSPLSNSLHLISLNLGRITVYIVAGLVLGAIGLASSELIGVQGFVQGVRIFTAVILIMIGVQLLISKTRPFAWLEKFGAQLWQRVQGFMPRPNKDYLLTSYGKGLIWAFLPCGLVYSVLLTTFFAQTAWQGGSTMAGFGLGTLPAMLLTGGLYMKLKAILSNRFVHVVGGLFFIQGGVLMLLAPYLISTEFLKNYPELMSTFFCLT